MHDILYHRQKIEKVMIFYFPSSHPIFYHPHFWWISCYRVLIEFFGSLFCNHSMIIWSSLESYLAHLSVSFLLQLILLRDYSTCFTMWWFSMNAQFEIVTSVNYCKRFFACFSSPISKFLIRKVINTYAARSSLLISHACADVVGLFSFWCHTLVQRLCVWF